MLSLPIMSASHHSGLLPATSSQATELNDRKAHHRHGKTERHAGGEKEREEARVVEGGHPHDQDEAAGAEQDRGMHAAARLRQRGAERGRRRCGSDVDTAPTPRPAASGPSPAGPTAVRRSEQPPGECARPRPGRPARARRRGACRGPSRVRPSPAQARPALDRFGHRPRRGLPGRLDMTRASSWRHGRPAALTVDSNAGSVAREAITNSRMMSAAP